MLTKEQLLELSPGYSEPKLLTEGPYAGHWAHLAAMVFTVAIMVSDSRGEECGWITRWCYESHYEAKKALAEWNGVGDPGGPWVKQKPEERRNPNAE